MIVDLNILFSIKPKIGSYIIKKGTKHLGKIECSHVSILVNNRWVYESTINNGVKVVNYNKWKKDNIEISNKYIGTRNYKILKKKFKQVKNKNYDFLGLIYFSICIFKSFFNYKIPKVNKWQSKDKYFCSELVGYILNKDYSMTAPCEIFKDIKCRLIKN